MWRWAWKILQTFFFNFCFQYQFLPAFFLPLFLCLALSHNFCRGLKTTNQPVKWWLPYPGEPAAFPGNYMKGNLKIPKPHEKQCIHVFSPDLTCLIHYEKHFCIFVPCTTEVCHLYTKHKAKSHKCHLLSFRPKNADNLRCSKGFCLCERWDWNNIFIIKVSVSSML